MRKPFIFQFPETVQIYSGNPKDAIPFLSIRQYGGKIIFQIPAGNSLEIEPETANDFAKILIDLSIKANHES